MKRYELRFVGIASGLVVRGWGWALFDAKVQAGVCERPIEVWALGRARVRRCTVFPDGSVQRERPFHRRPQLSSPGRPDDTAPSTS